jgi:hypothetical protein
MTKIFIDWIYTNSDSVYNPEILIDFISSYTFEIEDLIKKNRKDNALIKRRLTKLFHPFERDFIIKLITNLHNHIEELSTEHSVYNDGSVIPFTYHSIVDIESETAEIFCFDMNRRVVDLK